VGERVAIYAEQSKRFLLIIGALYVGYQLLNFLRPALTPFIIALLITYILRPVYLRFKKWGLPKSMSLLLTYLLLFVFLGVFFGIFIPLFLAQFKEFLYYIPKIQKGLIKLYSNYKIFLERSAYGAQIDQFISRNVANLSSLFTGLAKSISALGISLVNFFFELVLGLVISVFFLKDWTLISSTIKQILQAASGAEAVAFLKESNLRVAQFIKGQLTVALITGFLTGLFLFFLGVPLAGFVGVLVSIFDLVPYFGPIVAGLAAVLLALSVSPTLALWALVAIFLVQQIENLLISPLVVGRNIQIHPLTVLFALFLGGFLFDFIGIILAVPVAGIIKYWVEVNLLQKGGKLEEQGDQIEVS
jgi:predicted PurR-regulated permease PerM